MMRQRYRWEFTGVSWWSRAPSPAHGAEFHYTSNRPTVPCPPHSYAVTNLSIQNPSSFTAKKLPLCEPLLLGHCKTHIVRHTSLYTDKSFIPLPKILPCQKLAGYVVILPAKLETKNGAGKEKSLQISWVWNGWVILIWLLGFLRLKQRPSDRKGICDAVPGSVHFLSMYPLSSTP